MEKIMQLISSIDINRLLTIFDIQIAIGVFLFFFIFRHAFSKLLIKAYYIIIKSKKSSRESSMYKIFNAFFIMLGLYISVKILNKNAQVLYFANKIFEITVAFCITKGISSLLVEDSPVIKKIFREENVTVDKLICKILRILLWVIFFFVVINLLGFDLSGFGGLIAGLGIVSAVAALAAQDLVKSLLSGFVILTDQPFVIGDWIEVGDYQGIVIDITFRSVRIRAFNNSIVTIPNSMITETYVLNWNRLETRRFDCVLGISLDTPTEKVRKVIKEIRTVLKNNDDVVSDTVTVNLNDITTGSINIQIILHVKETEYVPFLMIKQDLYCSLLYLLEKENIDLVSYPTQTVYLNRKEEEITKQ